MSDTFWVVVRFGPHGLMPQVPHETIELAKAEASRLAKKNPGVEFFVFAAVSKFSVRPVVEVSEEEFHENILRRDDIKLCSR